jgi:hypothetical protein
VRPDELNVIQSCCCAGTKTLFATEEYVSASGRQTHKRGAADGLEANSTPPPYLRFYSVSMKTICRCQRNMEPVCTARMKVI